MSATFLLVRFLSLKESTYNTNRNVFYFISSFFLILKQSTYETKKYVFYCTLKALFILEIIKFWNVQIFKCQRHQMLKHETQTFYWIIWEVNTVWLQKKKFYQKFYEKYGLERILYKKEFEEVSMMFWTNFDSFAIAYLI